MSQPRSDGRFFACVWGVTATMLLTVLCNAEPTPLQAGSWGLSVGPSYAYLVSGQDGSAPEGGGVVGSLRFGLSEATAVRLGGQWTAHSVAGDGETARTIEIFGAHLGVSYALDVSRFSPKVEGGVGFLCQRIDDELSIDLDIVMGVALDYAIWSWLSAGLAFHYHVFATDPSKVPVFVDIGPRIELRL